jgi:hypothetical protein
MAVIRLPYLLFSTLLNTFLISCTGLTSARTSHHLRHSRSLDRDIFSFLLSAFTQFGDVTTSSKESCGEEHYGAFTVLRVRGSEKPPSNTKAVAILSILKDGESLGTARSFTDLLNVMGGSSYPRGAVTLGVLVSDRGYYESVKEEFKQFITDRGFADGVLVYKEQVGVIICTCMKFTCTYLCVSTYI